MLLQYTITGLVSGTTISAVVDTESAPFRDRIAWIQKLLKLPEPALVLGWSSGPNADGKINTPVQRGDLVWSSRDGSAKTIVDVFLTFRTPESAAAILNREFGLAVDLSGAVYREPVPTPGTQPDDDRFLPGSPLGPPYPGQPGRYQIRDGEQRTIGSRWRGTLAEYELRKTGFAFFTTTFWERVS